MKKIIHALIFSSLMLQGCMASKNKTMQRIDQVKKVMLMEEGFEQFFYWELKEEAFLWQDELTSVAAIEQYKDTLKLTLGTAKFKAAVKKEAVQNLDKILLLEEKDGDRINALLVHTGNIATVRKINHLEAQILNYQMERFPMFSQPTEFHGFILKNEQTNMIRVYFGSSNTEWPPHPTILLKEVEKETKNGWRLIRHLHNHYCKKDKDYIGILAPSLADAQYFKMLKEKFQLEKALITNGFHTVEIDQKDFEQFESH